MTRFVTSKKCLLMCLLPSLPFVLFSLAFYHEHLQVLILLPVPFSIVQAYIFFFTFQFSENIDLISRSHLTWCGD